MSDATKNNTSIRWGELYPALAAFAEIEGRSKSDIAREAVHNLLREKGMDVPEWKMPTEVDPAREILTIRWAGLLKPLTDRAIEEKASVAEIARRAVRYYLADMRVKDFKAFRLDHKRLTEIMSRIGGNLNQISLAFNADGVFKKEALSEVHAALKNEFKAFMTVITSIRGHLEQQQP